MARDSFWLVLQRTGGKQMRVLQSVLAISVLVLFTNTAHLTTPHPNPKENNNQKKEATQNDLCCRCEAENNTTLTPWGCQWVPASQKSPHAGRTAASGAALCVPSSASPASPSSQSPPAVWLRSPSPSPSLLLPWFLKKGGKKNSC